MDKTVVIDADIQLSMICLRILDSFSVQVDCWARSLDGSPVVVQAWPQAIDLTDSR